MNAGNINNLTWMVLEGNINDGFEDSLHFCGHILVAGLSWSQAECATLASAGWAASPADWADAISLIRAVWVAEGSGLNKLAWADEWLRVSEISVVRTLGAGDANVIHAGWAVWRADAAANVVVVLSALRVPEGTPLFALWLLLNVSSTSSVGSWLVAEGSVVEEFLWAEFPADFTIWLVSVLAWGDAVISDSYFAIWASALVDTNATAVSLFPAGIIGLLVPERLKLIISAILLLSLGLGSGLVGRGIVVGVVDGQVFGIMSLMRSDVSLLGCGDSLIVGSLGGNMVVSDVLLVLGFLWEISVDNVVLSVHGLVGFMNGLWVDVVVIVDDSVVVRVVSTEVFIVVISVVGITVVGISVVGITMVAILVLSIAIAVVEWVMVGGIITMAIPAVGVVSVSVGAVVSVVFGVATKVVSGESLTGVAVSLLMWHSVVVVVGDLGWAVTVVSVSVALAISVVCGINVPFGVVVSV